MNMTEAQWGRLFIALGQAPVADAAMNLGEREVRVLCELAFKGLGWEHSGILHIGDGDKADALDFAQRLRIDPETGDLKPAQTDEEMREVLAHEDDGQTGERHEND
jgi:hypothetical protein